LNFFSKIPIIAVELTVSDLDYLKGYWCVEEAEFKAALQVHYSTLIKEYALLVKRQFVKSLKVCGMIWIYSNPDSQTRPFVL
jgi:hypothetical protein